MNNLRLLALLGSSLLVSSALVLVACGDDEDGITVNPPDGSAETGTTDSSKPDSNVPKDDGSTGDTGVPDSGLSVQNWSRTIGEKFCDYLTKCCYGQSNVADGGALDGGGTFNRSKCVSIAGEFGFEGSNVDEDTIALGKVNIDQTKAKDCLDKIGALACSLTGAQLKAARTACFGALVGTVANGQNCRSSLECAPGHFCNPDSPEAGPPDGGVGVIGKCAPLRGSGGACNLYLTADEIADSIRAEEACSYRGGADNNLRCDSWDPDAGVYQARGDWKCAATVPNGAGCNTSAWCADGICEPDPNNNFYYRCVSPAAVIQQSSCTAFKQ
jgi:hypothetical protein